MMKSFTHPDSGAVRPKSKANVTKGSNMGNGEVMKRPSGNSKPQMAKMKEAGIDTKRAGMC